MCGPLGAPDRGDEAGREYGDLDGCVRGGAEGAVRVAFMRRMGVGNLERGTEDEQQEAQGAGKATMATAKALQDAKHRLV